MKICKWLLPLILIWFLGSAYWYTCITKGLCNSMSNTKSETNQVSKITDTWNKIKAKPLTVYFSSNSDDIITEGVNEELKNIVEYMKQNITAKIMITGHTNYHKNIAYTNALGLTRANKLKDLLVTYGAPADRISTISKGQSETVAVFTDPNAHNLNRRAVLSIIE